MARRSEHTQEELREMVLNAAESILVEDGIAALKVRNIAMDFGFTIGSIYMVFHNMADLNLHLKARTLDNIAADLQGIDQRFAVAEECLLELAKAYLAYAHANYNRWQMLFEHRSRNEDLYPEWYLEKVAQIFRLVERQFQRLKPEASQPEVARAARALWSGVHGICYLSFSGSLDVAQVDDVEATVVLLTQSFLRGWQS